MDGAQRGRRGLPSGEQAAHLGGAGCGAEKFIGALGLAAISQVIARLFESDATTQLIGLNLDVDRLHGKLMSNSREQIVDLLCISKHNGRRPWDSFQILKHLL